jgi:hypothetical protein
VHTRKHAFSQGKTAAFNIILPCHDDQYVTRGTGYVDGHSLLDCSLNIVLTWCFAVQNLHWKCPSWNTKHWHTAKPNKKLVKFQTSHVKHPQENTFPNDT